MRGWKSLLVIALVLSLGAVLAQKDVSVQEKMEKEETQIDQAVSQAGGTISEKLANLFHQTPDSIQKMRDSGQGWGKITLIFCMAEGLRAGSPKEYSTYDDALKKVSSDFSETSSYEMTAKRLKIDLETVMANARKLRSELHNEKRFPNGKTPAPNVP